MATLPQNDAAQADQTKADLVELKDQQQAQTEAAPDPASLLKQAIEAAVAADPNIERATVTLPTDALAFLRSEASRRGISTGEMLRTAIGTQKYLTEEIAKGAKLQLQKNSGTFDVTI